MAIRVQTTERPRHCWAFAGAAALEAAYRRKYNMLIDVSEEYVFHMGKAFALNRDSAGALVRPVENNSSLTGFQGSGDIAQKISENAIPPEDAAPYLQSQQKLLDILPVLGFAGVGAMASQEDYDAVEFCEQHIPLLAQVNARYRAAGWGSLGNNPSITALENTILADREVICDVSHKTPNIGGHVLLLIGFDRNRQVFLAKNHWGEGKFIEIAYDERSQLADQFGLVHHRCRRSDIRAKPGLLAGQLAGECGERVVSDPPAAGGGFCESRRADQAGDGLSGRRAA